MIKKYVAVDTRMSEKCCEYLESNGYTLIRIPCAKHLDKPVSAHPDMSLFRYKEKLYIDSEVEHLFVDFENIITINREVAEEKILKYPFDVEFNCVLLGNNLICNKKYVNKQILDTAKKDGSKIIHVKQGYTKCSICVVSENAIVTEDSGIAASCENEGIDVLLLKTRSVKLDGYNYGFIGGCSGLISDGKILFAGDIEKHPEYKQIYEFCIKHNRIPVSMSNEPLYDVGSIIEL